MAAARIFISYRRDDAAGYARAIEGELLRRFGADHVFMDVDDIGAGQGYAEAIESAVGSAMVLLVLIGRRWLGEREGQPPRLADPGDFVRREVAAALGRGMRIIPLLLDGASMPGEGALPPELRPLAGLQALEIGNTRFGADVDRLEAALRETLGHTAANRRRLLARRWALIAGGLVTTTLASAWLLRAASPARPAFNGDWQAEVGYDWASARHTESFRIAGQGREVHGSASFLGVPRAIVKGEVERNGRLSFETRSAVMGGGEQLHRYGGHLVGDEIRFVMQTEEGAAPHAPVEFVARRVGAAKP